MQSSNMVHRRSASSAAAFTTTPEDIAAATDSANTSPPHPPPHPPPPHPPPHQPPQSKFKIQQPLRERSKPPRSSPHISGSFLRRKLSGKWGNYFTDATGTAATDGATTETATHSRYRRQRKPTSSGSRPKSSPSVCRSHSVYAMGSLERSDSVASRASDAGGVMAALPPRRNTTSNAGEVKSRWQLRRSKSNAEEARPVEVNGDAVDDVLMDCIDSPNEDVTAAAKAEVVQVMAETVPRRERAAQIRGLRNGEQKSWSIPAVLGGKDENGQLCQGLNCEHPKKLATKICHHLSCQQRNNMQPVMLCGDCDATYHTATTTATADEGTATADDDTATTSGDGATAEAAAHHRFDVPVSFRRTASLRSANSDSGNEDDGNECGRFDKNKHTYSSARKRFLFNMPSTKSSKSKLRHHSTIEDNCGPATFTVRFYKNEDESEFEDESIPAMQGTSLKESIETMFSARGITFDTHSVFLDASKTPLPLAFDTLRLGGNLLHVRANQMTKVDERVIALAQHGQRNKKNALVDTDGNLTKPVLQPTTSIGKGSRFFASKDKAPPDWLHVFEGGDVSEHGDQAENDVMVSAAGVQMTSSAEVFSVETSWTEVIGEGDGEMTKKQRDQQEAIWELMVTECSYLNKLSVVVKVFQGCLRTLQAAGHMTEVDMGSLFANVEDVYVANETFWSKYLSQCVEEARSSRQPIVPSQLLDSFAKFDDLLEPYVRYCMDEGDCLKYLKDMRRDNDNFGAYLEWCENHDSCNRLKLTDLLVKPMQRITKYPLLLRAILKKTQNENERLSLTDMISRVERFVTRINTTLRMRHEQQKLAQVLERFDTYCPVDAVNDEVEKVLSKYCSFDFNAKIPGLPVDEQRCVLLEGPMKLLEKQGRIDVQAFLFTDMFLLTKVKAKSGDKFKIIRQPFRLNKIKLQTLKDTGSFLFVYTNEYGMLASAFTLQAPSQTDEIKWIQAIEKARSLYMSARAGHGSTFDFFQDDDDPLTLMQEQYPSMASLNGLNGGGNTVSSSAAVSPALGGEMKMGESQEMMPVTTTDSGAPSTTCVVTDTAVKRSTSDPRYKREKKRSDEMDAMEKPRPMSLIVTSSDMGSQVMGNGHVTSDTATWVLTNEKRQRSDSIPSDLSIDSRQTSGIGDSFRSINSDGGANRFADDSMRLSTSFPEVSNVISSVAILKAKFEQERCQATPISSPYDSSGSLSNMATVPSQAAVDAALDAARRRTSPPEFCEQTTIYEESEQNGAADVFAANRLRADSRQDAMHNSNDDLLSSSEQRLVDTHGSSEDLTDSNALLQHEYVMLNDDAHSVAVSEDTITGSKLKLCPSDNSLERTIDESDCAMVDCATQTLVAVAPPVQCDVSVQCDRLLVIHAAAQCEPALTSERAVTSSSVDELTQCEPSLRFCAQCVQCRFCRQADSETSSSSIFELSNRCCDEETQCDALNVTSHSEVSTQCGDFVELSRDSSDGTTSHDSTRDEDSTASTTTSVFESSDDDDVGGRSLLEASRVGLSKSTPLLNMLLRDAGDLSGTCAATDAALSRSMPRQRRAKKRSSLIRTQSDVPGGAALSNSPPPPASEQPPRHARSASDEPKHYSPVNGSPSQRPKRLSLQTSGGGGVSLDSADLMPGMRALQTLSESLETNLIRTFSESSGGAATPQRCNSTLQASAAAPTLHKTALINRSPLLQSKASPTHDVLVRTTSANSSVSSSSSVSSRRSTDVSSPPPAALPDLPDPAHFPPPPTTARDTSGILATPPPSACMPPDAAVNSSAPPRLMATIDEGPPAVTVDGAQRRSPPVRLRGTKKPNPLMNFMNKRNTWHFPDAGSSDTVAGSKSKQSGSDGGSVGSGASRRSLNSRLRTRDFAASADMLASPKKEGSGGGFRRFTFKKRNSDAQILETSTEEGSDKKMKKELKDLKKLQKQRAKSERKKEKKSSDADESLHRKRENTT